MREQRTGWSDALRQTDRDYAVPMADDSASPTPSVQRRLVRKLSRQVDSARFDARVRLDNLFLVDGHTLNVAGHVDRRIVTGPVALVMSPSPRPGTDALRVPVAERRSSSADTMAFSAHVDLAPLYARSAGSPEPPTLMLWVDGLRGGPDAATLATDVTTGRNTDVMVSVPPARDLGLQFAVRHDDFRRVSLTAKRLIPAWFVLRSDIVGTRLTALCRPSPIDAVMVTAAAVGPDGDPLIECEIETRGQHVAVHVDLVALTAASSMTSDTTWTLRAAAQGEATTAIGRGRSDLEAPTAHLKATRTRLELDDQQFVIVKRYTKRSTLAVDVRPVAPVDVAADDLAADDLAADDQAAEDVEQ
jgi:hypothetical protein